MSNLKIIAKKLEDLHTHMRFEKSKKYFNGIMDDQMKKNPYYEGSDEEYNSVVVPFWKQFGMKPDKKWFQYYGYLKQEFDPHFIPDDFFYIDLYRYFNDIRYDQFLQNKLYIPEFLYDVKKPVIVFKHMGKFFATEDDKLLTKEEAIEEFLKHDSLIIKPTEFNQGKGVKKLNISENREESLKILNEYIENGDFVLQEIIKQSEQMNSFNDTSINTIRIMTLILNNDIKILSSVLRIGSKGSIVDNYYHGGKERPINKENGYLRDYYFQRDLLVRVDDNNEPLKEELLKGYDKAVEITRLHSRFPHIRLIGWDIAIDENYEPIVIELNAYVGDNQRDDGPTFTKYTAQVLEEYVNAKKKI